MGQQLTSVLFCLGPYSPLILTCSPRAALTGCSPEDVATSGGEPMLPNLAGRSGFPRIGVRTGWCLSPGVREWIVLANSDPPTPSQQTPEVNYLSSVVWPDRST